MLIYNFNELWKLIERELSAQVSETSINPLTKKVNE